jgi:hypothetical protein
VGTGAANFGGLVGAFHIDPNRGVFADSSAQAPRALLDPRPIQAGLIQPACLSFGKPTITAKSAFPVNELHRAAALCRAIDGVPETVDNRPFARLRNVQSCGS